MRTVQRLKLIVVFGLSLLTPHVFAAECVGIESGDQITLELKPESSFLNCIVANDGGTLAHLSAVAISQGAPFALKAVEITPNGAAIPLLQKSSENGFATLTLQPGGRKVGITILPSGLSPQLLTVTYRRNATGVGVISYSIFGDAVSPSAAEPPGGTCGPRGTCTNPNSAPAPLAPAFGGILQGANATPACGAGNTPPPQQNQKNKVNLNQSLKQFETARNAIDQLPPGIREATAASLMVDSFYSRQPFDLKNNPNNLVHETYGNFFFGAAGAVMGYSDNQLLKAGAVVQQFQNYERNGDPQARDLGLFAIKLTAALVENIGDNPGDGEMIQRGANYANQIYKNDPEKSGVQNSCTREGNVEQAPPSRTVANVPAGRLLERLRASAELALVLVLVGGP